MKVFSFDVFDTCLVRLCGEPRLLYDVLSLKVKNDVGKEYNEHMRQQLVTARIQAGGKNLNEIYNNIAQYYPLPYTVDRMVELEIETEKEMLKPVLYTLYMINRLREKGRILFISDMYLPSAFIQERLVEFGFFKEGDRLFVSDEVGAWKSNGSLYRYIHEKEKITYRDWHHYGDNWRSDVKVPRRLGIHSHHLHYDYLPYEKMWREIPVLQYQYPAILAGVARAVRLSNEALDSQKAFVSNVSAPLMISWVLSIMTDAQKRGISHLYFCARDVHTHYLIARQLRTLFPNIEAHYLFISRVALYESPMAYEYLQQEGLADKSLSAIVDTCTNGKTLYTINKMLMSHGEKAVYGYFMEQTNNSVSVKYTNTQCDYLINSLYLEQLPMAKVHRLGGMTNLYETFFSINLHATTIGYERHRDIIRPVFGTTSNRDGDWHCVLSNFRNIKHSNDTLCKAMADAFCVTNLVDYNESILKHIAIPTLSQFIDVPYKIYINYLTNFKWLNNPFVGKIHGNNKGVWKRGSLFFSLPDFLSVHVRIVLCNTKLRRKLNNLMIWKNH